MTTPKREKTLGEILRQKAGFGTFIELLNKELRFGAGEGQPLGDMNAVVEDTLTEARRRAEAEGRPLEAVLGDMGLRLEQDNAAPAEQKTAMLRSLDWEVDANQTPVPPPLAAAPAPDEQDLLRLLQAEVGPVDEPTLRAILAEVSGPGASLVARAAALRLLDKLALERVAQRQRELRTPFSRLLLAEGPLDPKLFAQLLACEPFFPVANSLKGDFAEYLMQQLGASYSQFREFQELARQQRKPIYRVILESGLTPQPRFMELYTEFAGQPTVSLAEEPARKELAAKLPRFFLDLFQLVPRAATERDLYLVAPRPIPSVVRQAAAGYLELPVTFELALPQQFEPFAEKMRACYAELEREGHKFAAPPPPPLPTARMRLSGGDRPGLDSVRLKQAIAGASTVNLVRMLFEGALAAHATDIHLDPHGEQAAIRYRIDGLCYDVSLVPPDLHREIVARIKILADLDITEHRRAQDGHIKSRIQGKDYNFRIATLPTKRGEKLSIRIVDPSNLTTSLDRLGFEPDDLARVQGFIKRPHGMVLATGPVGSGKTTTLYSCLKELTSPTVNLMSIEDPVEFELPGVNQVEVNYELEFDFVQGLRALLRHDPNAILVGEIRDEETARIAVRAAMTGLLVFSSLHTNDTPGAVTTLRNFHIPGHLVGSSLVAVIAQRLVRKICSECKAPLELPAQQLAELRRDAARPESAGPEELRHGLGCAHCFQSGYFGRTGVYEILEIDPDTRDLIADDAPERAIRERALARGMRTLRQDGLVKVLRGVTTLEECRRVLG